jgi:hypothetical protein
MQGMAGFFSGATPTVIRGLSINVGMLVSYAYYQVPLPPPHESTPFIDIRVQSNFSKLRSLKQRQPNLSFLLGPDGAHLR